MEIKTKVIYQKDDFFTLMYNGKLKFNKVKQAIERKARKIISFTNAKNYSIQYNFDKSYQKQPGIYYCIDVVVDWSI